MHPMLPAGDAGERPAAARLQFGNSPGLIGIEPSSLARRIRRAGERSVTIEIGLIDV